MNRIRLLAGALAATSLAGCIVLPPPPMPYRPLPPGFRGDAPPMPFSGARRPPAPGWEDCDGQRSGPGNDCTRGAPGDPGAPVPGAR